MSDKEECEACGHREPTYKRLGKDKRREEILSASVDIAKERGYLNITREEVAERAGVSSGLVTTYFDSMTQLKKELMQRAVDLEILEIIAQGLTLSDPIAESASIFLRAKAIAGLNNNV